MNLSELSTNQDYLGLPETEKAKVVEKLANEDADFHGLPDTEKVKVLNHFVKLSSDTQASTDENKSVVAPSTKPIKRELDAKGRTLVPDLGEPTFAENLASNAVNSGTWKNLAETLPSYFSKDGFNPETVENANNFAAGATSMNRGIANLAGMNVQPKASPNGNPVDKSSGEYLAGNLVDPTSWAVGSGLSKLPVVGKSFDILPVSGKGKVAQVLHNIMAGSGVGGVMGGLSEDGTATSGAIAGGVAGGVLPLLSSAVNTGVNYGKHLFQDSDIASGRFANKAANVSGKRDEVIDALVNSGGMYSGTANSGQAAAKTGSAEFAGLQKISDQRAPTPANTLLGRQETQRASTLDSIGRDENMLANAVTARAAKSKPFYDAVEKSKATVAPKDISNMIDDVLAKNKNETAITVPLQSIKDKLSRSSTPQDFASLSKEISALMKTTVDNKPTYDAKVLTSIKELLDTKIGQAEPAYTAARNTFKEMSGPVNRMQVGQYLGNELKTPLEVGERASSFAKAVDNAPKTIKKSTGMERFTKLNQVLEPTEMSAVQRVTNELMNDANYNNLAKSGLPAAGNIIGNLSKPVQGPGILNYAMTTGNAVIRLLKGKITDKTLDALAKNMQNPQKMAELMQQASVAEKPLINEALIKAGVITGINANNMQGEQ